MLEALYESRALDGLTRRMQAKWRSLPPEDMEDLVGEAVDMLFERVYLGERVPNIVGFLWRVTDRKASDRHRDRQRELTVDLQAAEAEGRLGSARRLQREVETGVPDDIDPEDARKWAVAAARQLLPQLGQQNVQAVMAYVLDAVERDLYEVSNQEIGDALGLSLPTVRTSLSRGFRRLARAAHDVGIADLVMDLEGVVKGEEPEEEPEEEKE